MWEINIKLSTSNYLSNLRSRGSNSKVNNDSNSLKELALYLFIWDILLAKWKWPLFNCNRVSDSLCLFKINLEHKEKNLEMHLCVTGVKNTNNLFKTLNDNLLKSCTMMEILGTEYSKSVHWNY